jgi:adenylate cyclase
LQQRGTIDKYMGDAIMAFWNAPLDDTDHRIHACHAALAMAAKMDELNEMWRQRAESENRAYRRVEIGIGLNTGPCCVGNLGSTHRFDYSAIGDEVNVTSRFEGLTKIYGVPAIIGRRTLAPDFPSLELDTVSVKGRTRPTQIFTLIEMLRADEKQRASLEKQHGTFLTAYRNQEWDAAERLIGDCLNIGVTQLNTCYALFTSRIESLRKTSLPSDWDGAYVMLEK